MRRCVVLRLAQTPWPLTAQTRLARLAQTTGRQRLTRLALVTNHARNPRSQIQMRCDHGCDGHERTPTRGRDPPIAIPSMCVGPTAQLAHSPDRARTLSRSAARPDESRGVPCCCYVLSLHAPAAARLSMCMHTPSPTRESPRERSGENPHTDSQDAGYPCYIHPVLRVGAPTHGVG